MFINSNSSSSLTAWRSSSCRRKSGSHYNVSSHTQKSAKILTYILFCGGEGGEELFADFYSSRRFLETNHCEKLGMNVQRNFQMLFTLHIDCMKSWSTSIQFDVVDHQMTWIYNILKYATVVTTYINQVLNY